MTQSLTVAVTVALGLVALAGALTVVLARDVMRLALGLGALLLAAAGLFGIVGFGFLALAEVFLYVGGVLVLLLFAMMLVRRGGADDERLTSRHDALPAIAAGGIGLFLFVMLRPLAGELVIVAPVTTEGLAAALLGPLLPHFELAGLLLLAALVAVVAVMGGERE